MSVQISQEKQYINAVMAKLPEIKDKKVHVLQKGECLWSIAKNSLHKGASNQEISTLMLMIAKLNNLTTVETMNNIKANEKIYLPADCVDNNGQIKEIKRELNAAEKTALGVLHTLKTDKTIDIEDAFSYWRPGLLYHVYNEHRYADGFISSHHPVTSINMNKDGTIKNMAFNDAEKKINPWGFDYELNADGTIINRYSKEPCGKLSSEQMEDMLTTGENLINKFFNQNP